MNHWLIAICLGLFLNAGAYAAKNADLEDNVVVVDKKTNQLHLTNYRDGKLEIFQSFHATLGKKIGDKMVEGDLKTPEGIYEFLFRSYPPALKPIFGALAIYVSFPNLLDKSAFKTGFDILVHGTDDPSRLDRAYDSKGCVVLSNENAKIVSNNVGLKSTKIIITRDFDSLAKYERLPKARGFLENWLQAWSAKDIERYIDAYADGFTIDGMNLSQYKKYKIDLNQKYDSIQVNAEEPHFFFHEKYDLIEFTQNYRASLKNGATAYQMKAKKRLWVQERNGTYFILAEEALK